MKTNQRIIQWLALLAFPTLNAPLSTLVAQGTTAFTYQGQLRDGGTNANGTYTMTFKLYDAATAGNQIASPVTTSPTLANGLFTVNLDFGPEVFNGSARWLDITVQSGTHLETLAPRVQVLPSPYALFAGLAATVPAGAITNGSLAVNAVGTANLQDYAVTTEKLANGAVTDGKILSVSGGKIFGDISTSGSVSADGGFRTTNNVWGLDIIASRNLHADGAIDCGAGIWTAGAVSAHGDISTSGSMSADGGFHTTNSVWGRDIIASRNLHADGTIDCGGGIWTAGDCTAAAFFQSSDRNLKENLEPIDSADVLDRVATLPISRWKFKTDAATQHIGPTAQDFYAAFNVGADDTHIATVDEGGIALAAIQGLNRKLHERDAEMRQLKLLNASLEKRVADLERLVKSPAHKRPKGRR
jgi:hypothetical protein